MPEPNAKPSIEQLEELMDEPVVDLQVAKARIQRHYQEAHV